MLHLFGYLFRETGNNLRRNTTLFLATIVAVWVSLTMFGSAIIISNGVTQATDRWSDGVQFIIFMETFATPEQFTAIELAIIDNPEIELVRFVGQEEAYQELQEIFQDEPELVKDLTPADVPASFRVRPISGDAEIINDIAAGFRDEPGVRVVEDTPELLRSIQSNSQKISTFILVTSVVVLAAAVLLIINTIRTAVFARRGDIEIMKLVGASNWYIRVPFVLEGIVQGILGGLLAIPMLFILHSLLRDFVEDDGLELLQSLVVESSVVWSTSLAVVGLGALLGAVGSGIVVGRYIDS